MRKYIAMIAVAFLIVSCANAKAQIPSDEDWLQAEKLCATADDCSLLEGVVKQMFEANGTPDDIKSTFYINCKSKQDLEACELGIYTFGRLRAQAKNERVKLFASEMISEFTKFKAVWGRMK